MKIAHFGFTVLLVMLNFVVWLKVVLAVARLVAR